MGSEMVMNRLPGSEDDTGDGYGMGRPYTRPSTSHSAYDATRQAEDDVLHQLNSGAPKRHQFEYIQRFAGLGIGLSSVFAETLLSHPCIVLRRQCQLHHDSQWYHLTPFTLFHVLYNLQRNQSVATMWKGISSIFVVRGIYLVSESAISEFTPCPREVSRHSSLKKMGQHLILKGISCAVATPFLSASLVETVQSEIASERPGVLDCLKEGFSRLSGIGTVQTTRLLPVWRLLPCTVLHGVSHYIIKSIAQYTVMLTVRSELQEEYPDEEPRPVKSMYVRYFPELLATFMGNLLADLVLFPLETIMHRLHIQGTRTIIDNTDSGLGVVPINTRYEGFIDCFKCILLDEGVLGFYKGFGALIFQYMIHVAILKMTRLLFEKLTTNLDDNLLDNRRKTGL